MSSYCQSTLAFSAVALTVAGAAIFLLRKRSKQPGAKTIDVDVPAKIPDGCQKLVLEHYDIWGTVTLFEGGSVTECEKHLKDKFRAMVKANPWMAGWTEYDYGEPVIVHPSKTTDDHADSMFTVCNSPLQLCGSETAAKQVSKFCLPYGLSTVGKPQAEAPLVRLALMPCELVDSSKSSKTADIALVLFTSHVVGGARTHYNMLNMLSVGQPVFSFDAVRVKGVYEKTLACLGQSVRDWATKSLNHIGSALLSLKFGGEPKLYRFAVCPEKLAAIKKSSLESYSSEAGQKESFVSTNDIITSGLARLVGAELMQVTVDMRQRPGFSEVRDDCVGNYEAQILLDYESVKSPVASRRAIRTLNGRCAAAPSLADFAKRSQQNHDLGNGQESSGAGVDAAKTGFGKLYEPLARVPAWWKFPFSRHAKITNWANVAKDMVLPGCQRVVHFPAADDPDRLHKIVPYDIVLVFRLGPGQTGLAVVSRKFSKEDYLKALPLIDLGHDYE